MIPEDESGEGGAASTRPREPQAAEVLFPQVYDEPRRLAAHKLARGAPSHTLQPTALVHEAWLQLAAQDKQTYANRRSTRARAATRRASR